jgi:hypothetical protein
MSTWRRWLLAAVVGTVVALPACFYERDHRGGEWRQEEHMEKHEQQEHHDMGEQHDGDHHDADEHHDDAAH